MAEAVFVSVVVCSYNPRADLLARALGAIAAQTLPRADFELIVVDNNSTPPIALDPAWGEARLVREPRQGLIHARLAGIAASLGELIVFVDDDNELAPDYLEKAVAFAAEHADVGLFGGAAEGAFEAPPAWWARPLLGYLGVRDEGAAPIISREPRFGPWEPIGAGMVARRAAAQAYLGFVESSDAAAGLGRSGQGLFSCEDSLFARVANRQGLACAYAPGLRLRHHISPQRLKARYLFALIRDLGRSYVRLERLIGRGDAIKRIGLIELGLRFVYRTAREGVTGMLRWGWDLGYFIEARR